MRSDTKAVWNRPSLRIAGLAVLLLIPAPAQAGGLNPNFSVPSFQGQANTTYQEWLDNFTLTGTSPPAASSNPYGTANFTDPSSSSDGAFVITKQADGSGDIYSFSGVTNPEIVVPTAGLGSGDTTTIVFQFETYGQANPTLPDTVGQTSVSPDLTLVGSDGTNIMAASVSLEASVASQFGGFGTAYTNDYIATWTVGGSASNYTIDYDSAVTSSSFTSARIDTLTMQTPQSVPEPASMVSMSIGLIIALAGWDVHRRRKANRSGERSACWA